MLPIRVLAPGAKRFRPMSCCFSSYSETHTSRAGLKKGITSRFVSGRRTWTKSGLRSVTNELRKKKNDDDVTRAALQKENAHFSVLILQRQDSKKLLLVFGVRVIAVSIGQEKPSLRKHGLGPLQIVGLQNRSLDESNVLFIDFAKCSVFEIRPRLRYEHELCLERQLAHFAKKFVVKILRVFTTEGA